MRLYSGTSELFVQDAMRNQISEKLKASFFKAFRYSPSPAEVGSWQNSLLAMAAVIEQAKLKDHGILLEYQLPLSSKRLDCLITGQDQNGNDNAVIVELKQWQKSDECDADSSVLTWLGGTKREVLHPSVQVGQYQMYLQDMHTAFYEGDNPVTLNSCAYLHNYRALTDDAIYAEKFHDTVEKHPLFTANDMESLQDYLQKPLENGNGIEVLRRIDEGCYRPSKKLLDHVSKTINSRSDFVLLDEQKIAYDRVFAEVRKDYHHQDKAVIVIRGGPGTGKSVIAINLMADLLRSGYNAQYATGSKAFTETLRKIIGARGSTQFKYFNSYAQAPENIVDVLICDEAHRIRESSNSRFTKAALRSGIAQIEELINAAKVLVCFIDDKQVVRPVEIGSTEYILEYARQKQCRIMEYKLDVQFRCSGSESYIQWINNTLGVERTPNVIWNAGEERFDFRVMDSPEAVENALKLRLQEGFTARMTAGFCWPWSDPDAAGQLLNDVNVGSYKRPWNANPDAGRLAPGIPKSSLWAYDPNGFHQVGCIYTAQGFEFDYVGVIFGNDLAYDLDSGKWLGNRQNSFDSVVKRDAGKFLDLVKNVYRVLLTRGVKGCYVCFIDKDTERFFRSRMEH